MEISREFVKKTAENCREFDKKRGGKQLISLNTCLPMKLLVQSPRPFVPLEVISHRWEGLEEFLLDLLEH